MWLYVPRADTNAQEVERALSAYPVRVRALGPPVDLSVIATLRRLVPAIWQALGRELARHTAVRGRAADRMKPQTGAAAGPAGLGPRLASSLHGGQTMKSMGIAALIAVGLSAHLIGQQPVAVSADKDDKVTLVGCVIKGDGGYVLSNADGWGASSSGAASTTVASASSVGGRTFYWLKQDDDLEKHAGHKVEVVGKLDNEIDQAKIKVEREDGMARIEFEADGEPKVTIKAPESLATVGTSGAVKDREKTHRVSIRKIDVKSVKVLASTCQ